MRTPNPYSPPQAVVRDAPGKPGSAVKAVALGLVVDFGGTFAGVALFGMVYVAAMAASGVASGADVEQVLEQASAEFASTASWTFYVNVLIGLSCSVLGGYVCARIARGRELQLGAVLAAIIAGSGALSGSGSYSFGLFLILSLAGIGAVMAGAWLGLGRNRRLVGM